MRLFMVRHGESENNLKKLFTGWVDSPLTEKGYKEAESIRPFMSQFKFDKVYSSDLIRTVETAKTALPDCTPVTTPLLREYDVGSLSNKSSIDCPNQSEQIAVAFKNRDYTPFGGENIEIVQERLNKFLKTLEEQDLKNVAVFAHGGIVLTMLLKILGQHNIGAIRRPNCCIAVFDYTNGRWTCSSLIDPKLLNPSCDSNDQGNLL
ncbi:MAG: histidine phosphatase family protein [Clostridia bacterium]|nr:histidine phosphatase family protein [Clostridia bacterium]